MKIRKKNIPLNYSKSENQTIYKICIFFIKHSLRIVNKRKKRLGIQLQQQYQIT